MTDTTNARTRKVSVRLPIAVYEAVRAISRQEGTTLSVALTTLVEEGLYAAAAGRRGKPETDAYIAWIS